MIHFDHRRHRALSKAGNRAHGKLLVRRGEQDFLAVAGVARVLQPQFEFEARALQQIAGTTGVAGGTATDADRIVALRLQIKQSIESSDAVNTRKRRLGLGCDIAQRVQRKVLMWDVLLYILQDAEQRAGAVAAAIDDSINERLLFDFATFRRQRGHNPPPEGNGDHLSGADAVPYSRPRCDQRIGLITNKNTSILAEQSNLRP